jgi:hypothetical protein
MMAITVEIYHAEFLRPGESLSNHVHTQAFLAASAGFLPAFVCLQRLNSGSWPKAIRFIAPWLILLPDAIATYALQLRWFWGVGIAIPLGVVAYRTMLRIAAVTLK